MCTPRFRDWMPCDYATVASTLSKALSTNREFEPQVGRGGVGWSISEGALQAAWPSISRFYLG